MQHHVQFQTLKPFQLLSTFRTCEVLLSVVSQHVFLHVVPREFQLALFTLFFDISASIVLALDAMNSQLMFHQQISVCKSQTATDRPTKLDLFYSVNSEVELQVWGGGKVLTTLVARQGLELT